MASTVLSATDAKKGKRCFLLLKNSETIGGDNKQTTMHKWKTNDLEIILEARYCNYGGLGKASCIRWDQLRHERAKEAKTCARGLLEQNQ